MLCMCTQCTRERAREANALLEGFDNSRAVLCGETVRKNLKIVRINPDADAKWFKAIVRAHLGNEIPGVEDLNDPEYVMGPRDHFYELIRLTLKFFGEGFSRAEVDDKVYAESGTLWRAVGRTSRADVEEIVGYIYDALSA